MPYNLDPAFCIAVCKEYNLDREKQKQQAYLQIIDLILSELGFDTNKREDIKKDMVLTENFLSTTPFHYRNAPDNPVMRDINSYNGSTFNVCCDLENRTILSIRFPEVLESQPGSGDKLKLNLTESQRTQYKNNIDYTKIKNIYYTKIKNVSTYSYITSSILKPLIQSLSLCLVDYHSAYETPWRQQHEDLFRTEKEFDSLFTLLDSYINNPSALLKKNKLLSKIDNKNEEILNVYDKYPDALDEQITLIEDYFARITQDTKHYGVLSQDRTVEDNSLLDSHDSTVDPDIIANEKRTYEAKLAELEKEMGEYLKHAKEFKEKYPAIKDPSEELKVQRAKLIITCQDNIKNNLAFIYDKLLENEETKSIIATQLRYILCEISLTHDVIQNIYETKILKSSNKRVIVSIVIAITLVLALTQIICPIVLLYGAIIALTLISYTMTEAYYIPSNAERETIMQSIYEASEAHAQKSKEGIMNNLGQGRSPSTLDGSHHQSFNP
jgi:hypothetical protein